MARTIGKKYSGAGRGDYEALCQGCGVVTYRSKLRRMADGLWYCDCAPKRDSVTLDRQKAAAAARPDRQPRPMDAPVPSRFTYEAS